MIVTPKSVLAAISSCSGYSYPPSAQPNTEDVQFDFTITNNDSSNTIRWFKVTKPLSEMTIDVLSGFGWTKIADGDSAVYSGGTIPPGESFNFAIIMDIASANGTNNWGITASDNTSGTDPVSCPGDLALSVSLSGTDTTPPELANVTVSEIRSNSAKISWDTNEAANTLIRYDVNSNMDAYPFSYSDPNLVTSHSGTITTGIAAGVTYYVSVCSTDGGGNQTCSSEFSFTAATSSTTSTTATPVAISTVTTTTVTQTLPTVQKDKTAPKVNVETDLSLPFSEAPEITGRVVDNKNVINIEYSTDAGQNWLPVDFTTGIGSELATFTFTPNIVSDGNYELRIRASDLEGNVSKSVSKTLVIDRLPPMIGGNLFSLGPMVLTPVDNGEITTILGLELNFTASAVGGPIKIQLETENKTFDLKYQAETGLWTGRIGFDRVGRYKLIAKSEDGAGNITEREINSIEVVESGRVKSELSKKINNGKVYVYVRDPETQFWSLWDGKSFGQNNPSVVEDDGSYQFFLPSGTYYMAINSSGSGKITSQIFNLDEPTPFNAEFTLKSPPKIGIGFLSIPLPSIFGEKAEVNFKKADEGSGRSMLIGKTIEEFYLTSTNGDFDSNTMLGKNYVLSMINTWSPPAVEQLSVLNEVYNQADIPLVVVSNQETLSKVRVFTRKAEYRLPVVVDTDGMLVEPLGINSLPMHLFIDRNGRIKYAATGVLNADEISQIFVDN